jgi:SAM-dependent methyltransferase
MLSLELKGDVERVDTFLISGWALNVGDLFSSPALQIIQNDRPVISIRPQFPNWATDRLRDALRLPQSTAPDLHGFRLWFPLSNGIEPEIPFSIVFESTGMPLGRGQNRRLTVFSDIDHNVREELQTELLFVAPYIVKDGVLQGHAKVSHVDGLRCTGLIIGSSITEDCRVIEQDAQFFGRRTYNYTFKVSSADFASNDAPFLSICPAFNPSAPEDSKTAFHHSLRRLDIPRTVFDLGSLKPPLPSLENIHRVSVPRSNHFNFLVNGLTTFNQIDAIIRRYAGVGISEFETVIDWGVGCGRIMRHFLERREGTRTGLKTIVGVDIDEMNVKWCQDNLSNLSEGVHFRLLSLEGFDLPSSSVDLLYGISIFTHLSEHNQHIWLSEIRRVLKPSAIAILTVHGEADWCRRRDTIVLPFVQKFGFFDGVSDNSIGKDRSDYYRATFHSRPYILKQWGMYFEILDCIVMANGFGQDYVVVRRPV